MALPRDRGRSARSRGTSMSPLLREWRRSENCQLDEGAGVRSGLGLLPPAVKFRLFLLVGSVAVCRPEEDPFPSDDEAEEADSEGEGEAEPRGRAGGSAAGARVGADGGWADAMARILHRKTPGSKPPILVKNKALEREKEKLKQERLERRKQVRPRVAWRPAGVSRLVLVCAQCAR